MEELIEQAREANLDGLNMNFRGPATVEESIRLIREAGLGYYVWTVNDIDAAERAVQLGVDGLTTDRDRKSTRLNSSHVAISYAVFCLKKKNQRGLLAI